MSDQVYLYADWAEQPTVEERLARARKHLTELNQLAVGDSAGTDHSFSMASLQKHIARLMDSIDQMQAEVDAGSHNPLQRARFVKR